MRNLTRHIVLHHNHSIIYLPLPLGLTTLVVVLDDNDKNHKITL